MDIIKVVYYTVILALPVATFCKILKNKIYKLFLCKYEYSTYLYRRGNERLSQVKFLSLIIFSCEFANSLLEIFSTATILYSTGIRKDHTTTPDRQYYFHAFIYSPKIWYLEK